MLTLIEIVLQAPELESTKMELRGFFSTYPVAYHVVDGDLGAMIIPRTSAEGGDVVAQGIASLEKTGRDGATKHIKSAIGHLNRKQLREAVKESISAVESIARAITQESGDRASTLGDALKQLNKRGLLPNKEFRAGIEKLYAYTNSKEGIRHAIMSRDSEVTFEEAHFFFGVCVLLVDYLRVLNETKRNSRS